MRAALLKYSKKIFGAVGSSICDFSEHRENETFQIWLKQAAKEEDICWGHMLF